MDAPQEIIRKNSMPRYMRSTRRRGNDNNGVDDRSIFALIDEYEDENAMGGSSDVQPQAVELPKLYEGVIDVDDSDCDEMHDEMALICPCKQCRMTRKKAKNIAINAAKDPHLKCHICHDATVQGGSHFACFLICGHVYGNKCIKPWLTANDPPRCPVCKTFNPASKIITLYGESAREEIVNDAKIHAEGSHEREEGLRQKIATFVELTNVLFEGMKLYGDVLTPVACLR